MTLQAMQEHEAVTLQYAATDFRRQGAIALVPKFVVGHEVLDMRCLEGQLSAELARRGMQVTSLDGYEGAVQATNALIGAHGLGQPPALLWDLKELPPSVRARTFDSIVCLDLLNHVEDDRATLDLIRDRLRDDGQLVLLVPAFPKLLGQRDESLGHLRRYTKKDIISLLEQHGFTVETIRYWNTLALPPYMLLECLLRRKLSDGLRYRGAEKRSRIAGPLLRWWYSTVERKMLFPCGLSLFVLARKRA